MVKKLFGQVLKDMNLISEEKLLVALEEQKRTGKFLGRTLVDLHLMDENVLRRVLSVQSGIEIIDLAKLDIPPNVIALIPAVIAKTYQILPVGQEGRETIIVAVNDVLNEFIHENIRFAVGRPVRMVLADPKELTSALEKYYGREMLAIDDIMGYFAETDVYLGAKEGDAEQTIDVSTLEELSNQPPVTSLFNIILLQVCKDNASDIHLEPFESDFRVRYRVDGKLYDLVHPYKDLAFGLLCRFKIMSGMDISERRLPQDGRLEFHTGGRDLDLRLSTVPTVFGECLAVRVLDRTRIDFRLDNIGLHTGDQEKIHNLIKIPQGIILATGPTGCGKTTTLYAALKELNSPDVKLITTEDPVEYLLPGAIQVPIREKIGLTFSSCLRSILRQDPDIIFVGEIRDLDTAEIAIQASLTGHLVVSSLHTNDAPSAITRLMDMTIEPYLLSSTIIGIIGQRLVRTLCSECKIEYTPDKLELLEVNLTPEQVQGRKFYQPTGCGRCKGGFRGRTALFEVLVPNEELWAMVVSRRPLSEIRKKAVEQGMRTMVTDGQEKVLTGVTTIGEVSHEIHGYA
ncbi:MAG: GspE/PulE family protein [Candidatus Omnitrophica bacterium]|nr:GspE/PulE family protein [Candidatus Omnitrophota bacterium]